jgi:hypothetical protein
MGDSQPIQLGELSRTLFDRAARLWQWSVGLELLAGLGGVILSLVGPSLAYSVPSAIALAVLLCVAYVLRYQFDEVYENAETMRRQTILSEGLGWPIGRAEFNEWKSRAGIAALKGLSSRERPSDYYATVATIGPKRLADMTYESAFWTNSLYRKLRRYIATFLALATLALISILSLAPLPAISSERKLYLLYAVYLLIPVILAVDFLGLWLKLTRAISALGLLESHLDRASQTADPDTAEIMRLVSEYNCIVVMGVAIPNWLFKRHHDEIQASWDL